MQTARQSVIPKIPQINSEVKFLSYSFENTRPHTQTPDWKLKVEPSDPVPRWLPIVPSTIEILEPSLDNTHKMAWHEPTVLQKGNAHSQAVAQSNDSLESRLAGQSRHRQHGIFQKEVGMVTPPVCEHCCSVSDYLAVAAILSVVMEAQGGPREASLPLREKSPAA